MGGGFYETERRSHRATTLGYTDPTKTAAQIFTKRSMPTELNPQQIRVRECRDSEDHPQAFPGIIALDETGSMHHIPRHIIGHGLPQIIETCHERGLVDIAILFMAVGDHSVHGHPFRGSSVEEAPLQVGQFESSDERLDHWLSQVFLEGMGGGNGGESYMLTHIVASHICETDHWDKRGQKGVLITIGDEPCLSSIEAEAIERIFGSSFIQTFPEFREGAQTVACIERAKQKWHVHHIHCLDGSHADRPVAGWQELLGADNVHAINSNDVANTIAGIFVSHHNSNGAVTPDAPHTNTPTPTITL